MKKRMMTAAGLVLMGASSMASAEVGVDVGVGVKVSTLGLGVEVGMPIADGFVARAGLNQYTRGEDRTIDGIRYDADLNLKSTALFLDWHPMKGTFHLTAGYLFSSNKLDAKATPSEPVQIGDTTYQPEDIGRVNAGVNLGSGPYLGLGWGNLPANGLGFTFELGAVQMGTPDADLSVEDPNGVIAANNDIEKERANIEQDLDEFKLYPVISLGISYGF
jgi:hypothetical protein